MHPKNCLLQKWPDNAPEWMRKLFKMLNLEKCKKILEKNGKKVTDEEVKKIRELMYKIGNLDYLLTTERKKGCKQLSSTPV